ncbi:MAG: cytochrome c oxidase subunit II [Actinomycetota bacterium]
MHWLTAVISAFLLSACTKDAPLNFLHPEGPSAVESDRIWDLVFAIAVVVFVLVEGALVFVLFRYRQRSDKDAPRQVHGNTRLEIAWTIIPVLLLIGVAVPTVGGIVRQSAEPPADALRIDVIGHQWWWEYRYPDEDVITATDLHIPTGRAVYLSITSGDVIHSFWVPKLAGKQDAVPGRINPLSMKADRPGKYLGQCAEYCGLSHANMRLTVYAHDPADFDGWVENQKAVPAVPGDPLAARGRQLFLEGKCAGCHTIEGTNAKGQTGPNMTHFASRTTFAGSMFEVTDENLRLWLEDPPGRKPGSKMPNLKLPEDDILALVSFLQSLK